MKILIEIIGWIATIGTVVMYAPQVWKTIKTKSTGSLSKASFLTLGFGSIVWAFVCSMIGSYQGWSTNAVVLVLMLPVFYYLFNKNMKIFIPFVIVVFASIATTTVLMFMDFKISFWVKMPLNVIAGLCTGFGLLPQSIRIFKERDVKDYSLLSGILIMTFNLLWTLYWAGKTVYAEAGGGATYEQNMALMIISATLSFAALVTQLPVMYTYLKYANKEENA